MRSEDKSINNLSTDPPENVNLKLIRSGQSATITCTAEAHPKPSLKIFFNCGMMVARSVKTYTITEVNNSHVGVYQCVAENILGKRSSVPIFLTLNGKPSHSSTKIYNILSLFLLITLYLGPPTPPEPTFPSRTSQTTTNGNATGKNI